MRAREHSEVVARLWVYAHQVVRAHAAPFRRWPWIVRKLWKTAEVRSTTFPNSVRMADKYWGAEGLDVGARIVPVMMHEALHTVQVCRIGVLRWYWRYWRDLKFRALQEIQAEGLEAAVRCVVRGAAEVSPRDVSHGLRSKVYGLESEDLGDVDGKILRVAQGMFPHVLAIVQDVGEPGTIYDILSVGEATV